jgi:hypothetical protein
MPAEMVRINISEKPGKSTFVTMYASTTIQYIVNQAELNTVHVLEIYLTISDLLPGN